MRVHMNNTNSTVQIWWICTGMHTHTRKSTHMNIHTINGPSIWQKDLLLDLERLSTFCGKTKPSAYGSRLNDPHFCGSCVWSLLLVSLGIFWHCSTKTKLNWTGWCYMKERWWWAQLDSKWRVLFLIILCVWILGIVIYLPCLDSFRSNIKHRPGSESSQHVWAVIQSVSCSGLKL